MKRLKKSRFKNELILTLVYLLLVALCIGVAVFVVFHKHMPAFETYGQPLAEHYLDSGSLEEFYSCTMGILVYSGEGECIDSRLPLNFGTEDSDRQVSAQALFGPYVERSISEVLQGKTPTRLGILASEHALFTTYGRALLRDGAPAGALFLIRYLPDLYWILFGILVSMTAVYLAVLLCMTYIRRRKQKYAKMEEDYIANITHDLKSPVSSIKALSENLSLGVVEDEDVKKKYYSLLARESNRLQRTIQGILDLSALQSGQKEYGKRQLKLSECFEPIIEKYRTLCDDMMIGFEVSEALCALPPVYTDPDSIARLLDILLSNAVKFVREDAAIRLDAVQDGKIVTVCVRDNGIGISKEHQAHIFDRFYMVDSSYNTNGSGLGLAIARGIADALEEKLWVESSPGNGAAFYFTVHMK